MEIPWAISVLVIVHSVALCVLLFSLRSRWQFNGNCVRRWKSFILDSVCTFISLVSSSRYCDDSYKMLIRWEFLLILMQIHGFVFTQRVLNIGKCETFDRIPEINRRHAQREQWVRHECAQNPQHKHKRSHMFVRSNKCDAACIQNTRRSKETEKKREWHSKNNARAFCLSTQLFRILTTTILRKTGKWAVIWLTTEDKCDEDECEENRSFSNVVSVVCCFEGAIFPENSEDLIYAFRNAIRFLNTNDKLNLQAFDVSVDINDSVKVQKAGMCHTITHCETELEHFSSFPVKYKLFSRNCAFLVCDLIKQDLAALFGPNTAKTNGKC